jgi:hypothetical protein
VRRNEPDDVWKRVDVRDPEECWLWRGAIAGGYGQIQIAGVKMPAHRAAFISSFGTHPGDLFVCHRCDVKLCCNPTHLFLGTSSENLQDASRKGLIAHGERCARAKLTAAEVREIRRCDSAGEDRAAIADRFAITRSNVGFICRRQTWRNAA